MIIQNYVVVLNNVSQTKIYKKFFCKFIDELL